MEQNEAGCSVIFWLSTKRFDLSSAMPKSKYLGRRTVRLQDEESEKNGMEQSVPFHSRCDVAEMPKLYRTSENFRIEKFKRFKFSHFLFSRPGKAAKKFLQYIANQNLELMHVWFRNCGELEPMASFTCEELAIRYFSFFNSEKFTVTKFTK